MESTRYYCARCGEYHESTPSSYGFAEPALWDALSDEERAHPDNLLTPDLCVIHQSNGHVSYFAVANIEIPVHGETEPFAWRVWVSLSEKNFRRTVGLWTTKGREHEPPYFGWLSSHIPLYPDTMNLKTMVQTRHVGMVPSVQLEPTDHPLAIEQRHGIARERIQEIAETILHGSDAETPS